MRQTLVCAEASFTLFILFKLEQVTKTKTWRLATTVQILNLGWNFRTVGRVQPKPVTYALVAWLNIAPSYKNVHDEP